MNDNVKSVGLIGGGVIGAGWAARFALNGYHVRIYDPDPRAGARLSGTLDNAQRAYRSLFNDEEPLAPSIESVASLSELAGVDLVQESLPEQEALKLDVLAETEAAISDRTLMASSTSGLRPSRLQSTLRRPERFAVAHPFNPVYLMPLVELCAGEQTAPETIQKLQRLYTDIGMRPLVVRNEIDGFIADRLMEALWREALWLINDDVATAEEIDDAIRFGPGLRWAFMGTFLTYRVAGGDAGMRHFMSQFGPTLQWPWTKLMDVPDLDETLLAKIVEQSDSQAGSQSIQALETKRDDCLVSLLRGLEEQAYGAGETLRAYRQDRRRREIDER
ncbi:MAG: 3-hydroxyacyl-CoA dehydrogenase NAD-binding domain-containing protein [Pseudomonadota bacterium]